MERVKMKTFSVNLFALLLLIVSLSTAQAAEKAYVIGKGDSLTITVWGEGELSSQVVVRPDGKISLPGIGEMKAAGVTPRQLQGRITGALTELVFNPVVSVSVNTFPANSMVVYGPGTVSNVIPLVGKTTLLELLSRVRPDNNADLSKAYLEREGQKIASDFEKLFKEGTGELANLEVLASDRLFIPKSTTSLVFVEGAVGRPSSIPFTDNMTILQAIHQAGGFTKFADRNETIITRTNEHGTERIIVRLSDFINKGDTTQNIPLKGGDLIVVETSWF